jgi:nucleoside phosphorylase
MVDLTEPEHEAAALTAALASMTSDARRILAERLLSILLESDAISAYISGALLKALGDKSGSQLGKEVLARLDSNVKQVFERQKAVEVDSLQELRPSRRDVDVCILAVKEIELIACLRAFGVPSGSAGERFKRGLEIFFCEDQGRSIAISYVGLDGNVESALKIASLFDVLRFRLAVLVGMAAGVENEIGLGDVVVAEEVWAVDFERIRKAGASSPRPRTYPTRTAVWVGLTGMRNSDPGWGQRIAGEVRTLNSLEPALCPVPDDFDHLAWEPSFTSGVVFAGSRLIEDGSLPQARASRNARLLAAEMEGAGFAAAFKEFRRDEEWMVLRGIADFGKTPRPKGWQFASTYAAAALLRDGLRARRISIEPEFDEL